ncbi:MAG TPA: PD-(D/E)XK nuclease family protein [Terracidiphilus sp.]|nr:PD-(D/E)XK nuclease family protein [Terracidiphilus sp.]
MTPIIDERRGSTSASNAQADDLCAGRFLAQRGCPETTSDDAHTGRRIHAALEKQDPAGLSLAEEDIYTACRDIEARMLAKLWPTIKDPIAQREERLWCKVPGEPGHVGFDHSARLDCFYLDGSRALIVEYKTGNNDAPESPRHLQLRDQAVLLVQLLWLPIESVAVMVIQPLVTHSPEVTAYTETDIAEAEKRMFARVRASNDPASLRTPGEVQCKFCLAKSKCLEWQKWSGSLVPQMTSLLDVPVESWTPAQRGIFLDKRKVAQSWLDNAEAVIKAGLAVDPAFADGWTLKPGAIVLSITDAQECFTRFMAIEPKPATPEEFTARTKLFMAAVKVFSGKLKEGVNATTGAKGKALKAQMVNLLAGITEEKQSAATLVKIKEDA